MIDAALAQRERRLRTELNLAFDKVCDVETRMQIINCILPVALKWGAVCANEALEKAAVAGNQAMLDWNCTLRSDLREWAGRFVAARIRALKAEG